ncbi:Cytochrome c oxidase subunit 6C, partial [Dufourea novaeangliae]
MSQAHLAKPQLRHLHRTHATKSLLIMSVISLTAGFLYKALVSDPAAKRVEDFYKSYDPEASLKRMNDAGLMQS